MITCALGVQAAERARAKARKKASKQQRELKEYILLLAGWLLVFSSLPTESWSDEQVLALYRARWQVELVIKRMKQVLQLAQLRGKTALTNEATILALLVCWALQQRETAPARALLCYSLVQVLKLAPMGVHPLESLALALAAHLPDRSLQILREGPGK